MGKRFEVLEYSGMYGERMNILSYFGDSNDSVMVGRDLLVKTAKVNQNGQNLF